MKFSSFNLPNLIATSAISKAKPWAFALAASLALTLSQANSAEAKNFYVSKKGNNTSGDSWATAFNELNKIKYSLINPGDTVFIEGGVYKTPLVIGKSGNSPSATQNGVPIYFQNGAAPHNGQVILDGPGSGIGIDFGNQSLVQMNMTPQLAVGTFAYHNGMGTGLIVRNYGTGVRVGPSAGYDILNNSQIRNCSSYGLVTSGGFSLTSSIVNDNGVNILQETPAQAASSLPNGAFLVLTQDWICNSKYANAGQGVLIHGSEFSAVNQTQAYQCVFGPCLERAIENQAPTNIITAWHCLFLDSIAANVLDPYANISMSNITVFSTPHSIWNGGHNVLNLVDGAEMYASIVYGATVYVPTGVKLNNNFPNLPNTQFNTNGNTTALCPTETDPQFDSDVSFLDGAVPPSTLIVADFAPNAKGVLGSNVTSVESLLNIIFR
jgi:hypothetical protein